MALRLEAIDTNLILRAILNDIPEQTEKVYKLLSTPSCIFYVPDQAITEAAFVLKNPDYGLPRENIVLALREFLRTPRLDYNKSLFHKVFETYLAHPKLSFNDCYLACHVAEREKTPLWTFDKALARQTTESQLLD